jgi:hypothetical protein
MLCFDMPFDIAPALFEIELVPPFFAIVAEVLVPSIDESLVGRSAEPAKVLHHNTVEVGWKAGDCAAIRFCQDTVAVGWKDGDCVAIRFCQGQTIQRYSRLDLVSIPIGPVAAVFFPARVAAFHVGLGIADIQNTGRKS